MVQTAPGRRRRRTWGKDGNGRGVGVELLERERELDQLETSLRAAAEGNGSLLVLEGAAGLGKSRLLRWAVERAGHGGLLALTARSGEPERDFSFGVALALFERFLSGVKPQVRHEFLTGAAALSLPLFEAGHWGRVQDPDERAAHGLLHGLFWLTVNISARQPLLLAVDDLHWSDQASLRFLLYLVERLEDLPVALVVTHRPTGAGESIVDQLDRHPRSQRLVLQPLSVGATASLLAHGLESQPEDRFVHACYSTTGGNPFLVQAIVQALHEDRVEPTDSNAEAIAQLSPEVVRRHVLARISRLGPDAVALASALAVLGDGALLSHAAVIADSEPDAAASVADALDASGVIKSASSVSFVHPLLRAAVYEEVPPAQRARMHLRAARLMHEEHRPGREVAAQLLLSTRAGEPWAATALREAAAGALRAGSPEAAIRFLTRALNERLDRDERAEILLEMARAKATAGEPGAEDDLHDALPLLDDREAQARGHHMLGTVLYTRGATAAAARSFERGLALLEGLDSPLVRELHAGYFSAASLVAELRPRAIEHITPLLERPAGGETAGERAALATLAAYSATSGAPRAEAVALARRAWSEGQLLADGGPDGWAWSLVTGALTWTDEFEESLAVSRAVIEEARRRGSLMAYATGSFCALGASYQRGWLVEARGHGQAALDAQRYGWRVYPYAVSAWQAQVLMDQADLEGAERELEVTEVTDYGNALGWAWVRCMRARLDLIRGRPQEALDDALAAGQTFGEMGFANTSCAPWRPIAALAAHRLGQTEKAVELLARESELARGVGAPTHIATVLRTQAQLQDGARAVELLREAVDVAGGRDASLEALRCTADLGAALRRAGQRAEARRLLTEAADQAHRWEARLIEQQALDELRVAGARPRRLAFSGPESLTASERRVAEMAIRGQTNREIAQDLFVTPRTVEHHLYNAFKKLGITSRAELAGALGGEE